VSIAAVGLVGALAACGGSSASSNQTKAPASSKPATATSAPPFVGTLPASCDPVAKAGDVDKILGHPLTGSANLIKGIAEPSINRTGRLDCYYGIPPNQPVNTAVVSIGIGAYGTPADAAHRVLMTVNQARDTGYMSSNVQVNGQNAVLLAGQQNQEVVLSAGTITVLVTASNSVVPAGKAGPPLIQLAARALKAAEQTPVQTPASARPPSSSPARPRPTPTKQPGKP
ncbi:MAG TPA: hypothetical protein VGN81_12315, partial [Pseudonocardiaceae bacterium]